MIIVQINLKELASGGEVSLSDRVEWSEAFRHHPEFESISPADVKLTASFTDGVAVVEGQLKLQLVQSCSRCLNQVNQSLTIPFRELFTTEPDKIREDENEMYHLIDSDRIDLDPYLEEIVLVALPIAPLCDAGCKGICPICGSNQNEQACSCQKDIIDPRLAGLADFFKDK